MTALDRQPLVPLSDVAVWLGVSPDLVYRLCRAGRLRGIKIGGLWRFRVTDVERFLDSHTGEQLKNSEVGSI